MKKCQKGFVLVETIIAAVFVMTLFTFFFTSIFPLTGEYERRKNYDDIDTLYAANYIREIIFEYLPDDKYPANNKRVVEITCDMLEGTTKCDQMIKSYDIERMFLIPFVSGDFNETDPDIYGVKNQLKTMVSNDRDFAEYVDYIPYYSNESNELLYSEDYRLIISREKNGETYYANTELMKEVVYQLGDTSGANTPVLVEGMIPVVWDGTNWVKSDLLGWYNYSEQQWANVVTVSQSTRQGYKDATVGTVVNMDDINGMFVWIPRYAYTIKDIYGYQAGSSTPTQSLPGMIDIQFVTTPSTADTKIQLGDATYTTFLPEDWAVPPAFCWGATCDDQLTRTQSGNAELPGIWVAKFETSTTGNTTSDSVQQPIIKPNVTSWRNVSVSNAFNSVATYMNGSNGSDYYGLPSAYDTHMMKNTEWAAVAYLSQSIYGKYGNEVYSGADKEVAINNCANYITGIGGDTVSATSTTNCTNTYESVKGQAASTTGNITGVYDMSGGAWEMVMASIKNSSGNFYNSETGFSETPEPEYYNSYKYGTLWTDTDRSILGDATVDTKSFYGDTNNMASNDMPWQYRGGNYAGTTASGIFNYSPNKGMENAGFGFRITITPQ